MISVQTVFERVKDLSRKDKAGYTSAAEFNRNLAEAQTLLMDWYYKMFEANEKTLDSLAPFIKETSLLITNQFCAFPTDYRHKLEGGYNFTYNNCDGVNPTTNTVGMQHLKTGEVMKTLSSAIRKPKIDVEKQTGKFAYTFVNNMIKVYPKELTGSIYFKYITDPPVSLYNVTIDLVNQEEDYDPATSIDLQWGEQDQSNLVDLMLFFKGIQVREGDLLQWVVQKHQYSNRQ